MEKNNFTLDARETELIMDFEKDEKTVFTIEDAEDILDEETIEKKRTYRLKKKNRISSIEIGGVGS